MGCRADDDACAGADRDRRYETREACEADRSECFETREACRAEHGRCVGPVATEGLTCGLSEDAIVSAALRLGACGVASTNDVIGGLFELGLALRERSPSPGYVPDCSVVRCAESARGCAELEGCLEARRGAACDPATLTVCVGDEVYDCDREGFLVPIGDCAAVSGTCAMEALRDGRPIAYCDTPGNPGSISAQTWCDEDELIVNIGGESVRLSCSETLPGTTCREIRYAGEFPGEVCGYPDPTCSEYLSSAVSCDGVRALLCVGGRERAIDCPAEGFARCEDGWGCVY